jgi:molecular chaperone DnaK (HSP70)
MATKDYFTAQTATARTLIAKGRYADAAPVLEAVLTHYGEETNVLEATLGGDCLDCLVTVLEYCDGTDRDAVREAAKEDGLPVRAYLLEELQEAIDLCHLPAAA